MQIEAKLVAVRLTRSVCLVKIVVKLPKNYDAYNYRHDQHGYHNDDWNQKRVFLHRHCLRCGGEGGDWCPAFMAEVSIFFQFGSTYSAVRQFTGNLKSGIVQKGKLRVAES